MHKFFTMVSNKVTKGVGSPYASIIAIVMILFWAVGLMFVQLGIYNQLYQTGLQSVCGIITFLMVFFIQHSQNIDSTATQIKLDHIITRMNETDSKYAGIEEKTEPELVELKKEMVANSEES